MITHNIIVKKEESYQSRYQNWPYQGQHHSNLSSNPFRERRMDKLEYTNYISNQLGLKDGDIVYSYSPFNDNGKSVTDLHPHRFFFVDAVQELHYSVEYSPNNEPRCLFLTNFNTVQNSNCGFWTSKGSYKKVDYNDLNMECKKIVDSRNNRKEAS